MAILTDRTELNATPATGDFVHIVDVDDNTDTAAGTSKKITVDNLTSYYDAATATLTNKTIDGDNNTLSDIAVASTKLTAGSGLTLSTDTLSVDHASIAETDTGTETAKAVTPDGLQGSIRNLRFVDFIVVDAKTDVATGTDLIEWECPFNATIIQDDSNPAYFSAWNATAGTTGTMVVDVHLNGTTIMTTNKLDIETGETSTRTAATQPDVTTTDISAGDLITIDVDAIHTTAAKGLTVRLALRPD